MFWSRRTCGAVKLNTFVAWLTSTFSPQSHLYNPNILYAAGNFFPDETKRGSILGFFFSNYRLVVD